MRNRPLYSIAFILLLLVPALLKKPAHSYAIDRITADTTGMAKMKQFFTGQKVIKVVPMEYWVGFLVTGDTMMLYNGGVGGIIYPGKPGGHTIIDACPGFNYPVVVTNVNTVYAWSLSSGPPGVWTQVATDTSNATFNNVARVYGYANTFIAVKNDGTSWYWGDDTFHIYHNSGAVNMRPIQLGAGTTWNMFAMGGPGRVVGLSTAGGMKEWNFITGPSGTTRTLVSPPAGSFVIKIFASHLDWWGALVHDYAGGDSTCGHVYFAGSDWGTFSNSSFSSANPTSFAAAWGMATTFRDVSANWNTWHGIDSAGNLWGSGYDVMGEVGDGFEAIDKYYYTTFGSYGWDLSDHEYATGVPPKQVGLGHVWKKLFDVNSFFTLYSYASDQNDSVYHCGCDKSVVSADGNVNLDDDNSRCGMNHNVFTIVHPFSIGAFKFYHFTAPNIGAGSNQSVTLSSTTLTATGHPALLINRDPPHDTLNYTVSSWLWTKSSGPTCTINSPTSKSTSVSGLSNGTYIFNVLMTDNNGGQDTGQLKVTVNLSTTPPTVNAGTDQAITLPTSSVTLTGTASGNGGTTISSTTWTRISGPNTPTITSPSTLSTTVTGLIQGTYVFQLSATDSNGNTNTDIMQVTVNAATGNIPMTHHKHRRWLVR